MPVIDKSIDEDGYEGAIVLDPKCNIYTSPYVKRINERFVYNDQMINDNDLTDLLYKIEELQLSCNMLLCNLN